ncbi:helix-turn-helix domain-containing protein [Chloroflexota bacterium]
MKQVELAKQLGVSKAYISMVMSGKKKPSKRVTSSLNRLGVNHETVNFEANNPILSHARLPIPTLPLKATLDTNSTLKTLTNST